MNLGHFKVALHNVKKPLHTRGVVLGCCLQILFCKEQYDTGEQKRSIEVLVAVSLFLHLAGMVCAVSTITHPTVFELDIILDRAQSQLETNTG